jgi:hypothetical protein
LETLQRRGFQFSYPPGMDFRFQHSYQEKSNMSTLVVEPTVEVLGSALNVPAPIEKQNQIEIPSLQLKLGALLPGDRQVERRARKLASQLSKGKRVRCEWDNVSLSELTPAESRMSDDDFLAIYTDQVNTPKKKGGRPKKYRTATARRKGHAERQRRYRERKLLFMPDVTKTTSQLVEV